MTDLPETPFTSADAIRVGITPRALHELVVDGCLTRITRDLYHRADRPLTRLARAEAIARTTRDHVIVCDRTAAWLHGVDTFGYAEFDTEVPVETFALRGSGRPSRQGCYRGSRDLSDEDCCEMEGIKVTTPVRTALDLACRLHRHDALAALDALMRAHGFSPHDLEQTAKRLRGRRGIRQARQLIALADPRAESPGESWARLALIDAGLVTPEVQWWVERDGVAAYRLDLAYCHAKIAIEYDGVGFHTRPEDRAADCARREWLRSQGWLIIVVTKDSFGADEVLRWTGQVRRALADRVTRVRRQENFGPFGLQRATGWN